MDRERPLGKEADLARAIAVDLQELFSLMGDDKKPPKSFPLQWVAEKLVERQWVRPNIENRLKLGGDMLMAGGRLYAQLNNEAGSIIPRETEIVILKMAPDQKAIRDLQQRGQR